jgi:hypothetical protein
MPQREAKRDPSFILRSNSISVMLTLLALAATVAGVYLLSPRKHNELMTRTAQEHRAAQEFDIVAPDDTELRAWSIGSLGAKVPWPEVTGANKIIGARSFQVQKRPTGLVQYDIGGVKVTLMAQRARDPAPRKHRRTDGKLRVVSWRSGKWTMIAAGDETSAEQWKPVVGAP